VASPANEITGDKFSSLVDQLVKGMLAISACLPPVDWTGVTGNVCLIMFYTLTIAFHRQLLEIAEKRFKYCS
jgi:hypothetical protein